MAVHTFSTKGSKPLDTKLIEDIKRHCDEQGLVFSTIVITQLRKWAVEHVK